MKKFLSILILFAAMLLIPNIGLAEDMAPSLFFADVMDLITKFGGMPWMMKISGVVALLLSSMKVSFIRSFVWDKLGAFKAFAAPLMGMVIGLLAMEPFTWSGLLAYMLSGAGAIALHEMLDALKSFPGIGPAWMALIEFLSNLFGGAKK